ncbi:MAG: hypothetical protein JWQ85_2935 [Mucilaginibacter sp.]|nr:hypothetical protein [Mucilaginibacter sp.]
MVLNVVVVVLFTDGFTLTTEGTEIFHRDSQCCILCVPCVFHSVPSVVKCVDFNENSKEYPCVLCG